MPIFKRLQRHIDAALTDPTPPEPPQRFAGSTLPPTDDVAEAVRTRGARHVEVEDGGAR